MCCHDDKCRASIKSYQRRIILFAPFHLPSLSRSAQNDIITVISNEKLQSAKAASRTQSDARVKESERGVDIIDTRPTVSL